MIDVWAIFCHLILCYFSCLWQLLHFLAFTQSSLCSWNVLGRIFLLLVNLKPIFKILLAICLLISEFLCFIMFCFPQISYKGSRFPVKFFWVREYGNMVKTTNLLSICSFQLQSSLLLPHLVVTTFTFVSFWHFGWTKIWINYHHLLRHMVLQWPNQFFLITEECQPFLHDQQCIVGQLKRPWPATSHWLLLALRTN